MVEKKYYYSVGSDIAAPVRIARIKIKRSVFTSSIAFVDSPAQAKAFISKISKENKMATHNCWAYVVGEKGETCHCSDAGEPAGTAGKPMLNTLLSHVMTQVAAVVTRQYGGVKLGIRGLIQAYSESMTAALEQKPLVRLVKTRSICVTLSYGLNEIFLNQLGQFRTVIQKTDYSEHVIHEIEVDNDDIQGVESLLSGYKLQGKLDFEILLPG
jgi:uncharacterized YigZ family protein